jgi:3-phenylpropionate/cinnamic acid dioxygenase small subunit
VAADALAMVDEEAVFHVGDGVDNSTKRRDPSREITRGGLHYQTRLVL